MFHLFTHAFFKSLLFLGAGSVIHAVHSNEMKDMGGLKKYLPITHITFLIACLAIAGIPPFAGFFSKEGILHAAYESNPAIYYVALITSGITAFYMFRLYYSIFWNKQAIHLQNFHGEGTLSMKLPLIILGTLSAVVGFIPFANFITPSGQPGESHLDILFSIAPVLIGITGIIIATVFYKSQNNKADNFAASLNGLYKSAYHKFYIDEVYTFITKKVIFNMIGKPAAWFDKNVVDGLMNAIGNTTTTVSESMKELQSGKVQEYALYFIAGVIGLSLIGIYLWM